jgi:integrase
VLPLRIKDEGVPAFTTDDFNRALRRALKRQSLTEAERQLRLTSHSFRKAAASALYEAGIALVREISDRLRHRSDSALLHYIDVSPEEAAQLKGRFFRV